ALEGAGLVERAGNPRDTRAVQLALTPDGVDVVKQAIVIVGALQERLTAPLGGTRSKSTRELVDTLAALHAVPFPDTTGDQPRPTPHTQRTGHRPGRAGHTSPS